MGGGGGGGGGGGAPCTEAGGADVLLDVRTVDEGRVDRTLAEAQLARVSSSGTVGRSRPTHSRPTRPDARVARLLARGRSLLVPNQVGGLCGIR